MIRMPTFRKDFGARLRRLREEVGLSRPDFAGVCFLSEQYIYRLERGDQSPRAESVAQIIQGLEYYGVKVSVDWLYGRRSEPPTVFGRRIDDLDLGPLQRFLEYFAD